MLVKYWIDFNSEDNYVFDFYDSYEIAKEVCDNFGLDYSKISEIIF